MRWKLWMGAVIAVGAFGYHWLYVGSTKKLFAPWEEILHMSKLDLAILVGILLFFYLYWIVSDLIRRVYRFIESDDALVEVVIANVNFTRAFLIEACKLSSETLDLVNQQQASSVVLQPSAGFPSQRLISGLHIELRVWKGHYSGEVKFYGQDNLVKSDRIFEVPTASSQFPMLLSSCEPLMTELREQEEGFDGHKPNIEIEVLLSHKALIIRGNHGDLGNKRQYYYYQAEEAELVIPTRDADLAPFYDMYGRDDPDWLRIEGGTTRYKHAGRWARWSLIKQPCRSLSRTTRSLDHGPVVPKN